MNCKERERRKRDKEKHANERRERVEIDRLKLMRQFWSVWNREERAVDGENERWRAGEL